MSEEGNEEDTYNSEDNDFICGNSTSYLAANHRCERKLIKKNEVVREIKQIDRIISLLEEFESSTVKELVFNLKMKQKHLLIKESELRKEVEDFKLSLDVSENIITMDNAKEFIESAKDVLKRKRLLAEKVDRLRETLSYYEDVISISFKEMINIIETDIFSDSDNFDDEIQNDND